MTGMGAVQKTAVGVVIGAVVVGVVVTGTIIGWRDTWEWITGWWTPGWGNLFTVGVAALAIMVSARHNAHTLRMTGDQFTRARRHT